MTFTPVYWDFLELRPKTTLSYGHPLARQHV